MSQPASHETKLSSTGFDQLPFHWVRDNRHCTLEAVSGHCFFFLCDGSSSAQTQSCCFSWFVKGSWGQKLSVLSKWGIKYQLQDSQIEFILSDTQFWTMASSVQPKSFMQAVALAQWSDQKHIQDLVHSGTAAHPVWVTAHTIQHAL